MRGNGTLLSVLTSSGIAALFIAGLSAYVKLDEAVTARPTVAEVRQTVEDMTSSRFDEVMRRFDRLDRQLDRLTMLMPAPRGQAMANDPENWPRPADVAGKH